jgi:mannose-6-phosphate isomerase-like protein (cupin superfamily)
MNSPTIAPPLVGGTISGSDDGLVIAEWTDEGGSYDPPNYIAPLHVHHTDDEAWYVLEGRLCVQRGDEVVECGAGAGVVVPKGVRHTYWNPGPDLCRYLLIMTDNIHRLIQGIHALPDRNRETLQTLFQEHRSELL